MNGTAWTETQINTLRTHWADLSAAEIAALVGKSRNAVIGKANRLGLPFKANNFDTPWTPERTADLKRLYPTTDVKEIAKRFGDGFTATSVRSRALHLHLKKLHPWAGRRGWTPTPETRARMRASALKRWARVST